MAVETVLGDDRPDVAVEADGLVRGLCSGFGGKSEGEDGERLGKETLGHTKQGIPAQHEQTNH